MRRQKLMKFMFVSPQSGRVTLCCSQEKQPVITSWSWHVVCQTSKQWQFVCGWKPLIQGMKEHHSAMLCLVATTNYSCLTIGTLNHGWAPVKGTNMLKPDISINTFLFTISTTQYSPVDTRFLHWLSLKTMISQFSTVLFPDYPNFEEQKWLSGENACLPKNVARFHMCMGWVCYWSVFASLWGFFVGVFWISSRHKTNLQKTAKANAMAIAPTKCWSNKFHIWSRFE